MRMRYARLLGIEGVGEEGLQRILRGKVLIIGAGALGSVCAMYLAGSGVGCIGIAEFDTIDLSNLQRQVFFSTDDCGAPKLSTIVRKIHDLNPGVLVKEYPMLMKRDIAVEVYPEYDFIIDATDNPSSKKMTDSVASTLGIPYCIGGVREAEGQVISWTPGALRYSDIFPEAGCSGFTPCSIAGVLGPAAGVVASIQAAEAIKYLSGVGTPLFNRLWTFNLFTLHTSIITLA